MQKISLYNLEKSFKNLLASFVLVLTVGVIVGIIFLSQTTEFSSGGTVEHINGTESEDEFEMPEKYPKSSYELLVTTHTHIIGFSLIFISICLIFYFNSIITGFWKSFFTIEPFISIIITFGSIWGIRYISPSIVYLTIISSCLMYFSYFFMAAVILYELKFK